MKNVNFESGKFYHLFNRGNNKELLFYEDENYHYFLQLVKKYLTPILDIYSYCLIPNHFHFLIKIKEEKLPEKYKTGEAKLHQPFSNLFNAYTKALNKRIGRRGSLFQEHLKRNEVNTEKYLKQLIVYIHLNPNHHGLDIDYKHYQFSSFKALLSEKPTLLQREVVIELFEDLDNFKNVHQSKNINDEILKQIIDVDD